MLDAHSPGDRVEAQAHGRESIRGRQPTVDVLIGHEHYPRIRRLRTHYDWQQKLSLRTLIGYENYQKIRATRTGIEKVYGRTCLHRS